MTDQPTAGRFEGRDHLLPIRVYYEDTDFTGLVYHGSYVRYFERGRSDFLRLAGVGHADLLAGETPMAFVVSRLNLTYLKPARIDDALIVRTTYEAMRGPRLMIRQVIERQTTDRQATDRQTTDRQGEILCRAEVEAAVIDLEGRPRRPSRAMMAAVRPWLSSSDDAAAG